MTTVTFGAGVSGFLARPEGEGAHPGVVVIQEWWGMNAHIKDVAERFAAAGFVAIAPDLYHGHVATEPDEARKLAMALDFPRAVAEIQAAVDYLVAQPFVAPKSVGVVGFCMGGRLTGMMAYQGRHVGAVVPFYGIRELSDADAAQVSAPVLAIYGESDGGFPAEVRDAVAARLRAHGKRFEMHVYPDAPHAFFNNDRPQIYKADAAADAWGKTLAWFREHLR